MARRSPIRCRHGPLLLRSRSASRTRVPGRSAGTPCCSSGSPRTPPRRFAGHRPARTHRPARRSTRRHAGPGRPAPPAPGRPPSPQRPDHPWHGSTTRRPTRTPVINGTPTRSHRCHRRSGGSCSVIVAAVLSTGFQRREEGTGIVAYCLACGLRTGIAPGQWSMRRMRRSGRLRSGWRRTGTCGRRTRSAVTRPRWRSGGRSWSSAARRGGGPRLGPGGGGVLVVAAHRPHRRACSDSAVRGSVGGDAACAAGRADLVLPVAGGGPLGAGRGAAAARAGCPMPSRGLLAHLDGRRRPGPSSLVKVRRRRAGRPPLLLPQEIQAIIDGCATWDDAAGEWAGNLRDRLLFSLLAESGMRLGEVLGMAISDFVMGRGGTAYIEVVPRAGNPNLARVKMMRPRRIYVSADLERLFADYLTHLAGRAATTAVSWRRLSL